MPTSFASVWKEPRAAGATGPRWHDWVLVAVVLGLSAIEVAIRDDIVWLPFSVALNTLFALVLPWRRLMGVYAVALVIGLNGAAQQFALSRGVDWNALHTGVLILILPYALVRWASGKHAIVGLAIILFTFALSIIVDRPPWGEITGAILFLLIPITLGLSFRFQRASQHRENEQIRLRERERLARDLHDSVGHYMSAIAVQAQAGRTLAPTNADAPLAALEIIETASRNALAEMRSILRTMRDDQSTDYQPAASLKDVKKLAENMSYPFPINVVAPPEIHGVDGVIASTLYRLTQESITNAARHGRNVSHVNVTITAIDDDVLLLVQDDGQGVDAGHPAGLGLLGMRERVALLGGQFEAGPIGDGGWLVRARLPVLRGSV